MLGNLCSPFCRDSGQKKPGNRQCGHNPGQLDGAQQDTEYLATGGEFWANPDAGNGVRTDGSLITGNDPHAMLNGDPSPPLRTKNYWPMYVVSRTLGLGRREAAVDVLPASSDQAASRATVHAVRARDGALGILLVNKGDALTAEVSLAGRSCSTPAALKLDGGLYDASSGPAPQPATCSGSTLADELPRLSVVGVVLAP